MSQLHPNLETKGRLLRGAGALAVTVVAARWWPHSRWAGSLLGLAAAFLAFEAVRGWCALRACGVKTRF